MSSINNPINNKPRDPYEGYKVEAIEEEKRTKEELERKQKEKDVHKPQVVGAYLLLLMRRFLQLFSDKTERGVSSDTEKEVRGNLLLLKAALEILKAEDRSQDVAFLNRLSELWHQALEDSNRFRRNSPFSIAFRTFLRDLQHYPPEQEHTLGYYLIEYAGQKWLPFPYMELIATLHREYELDPESSPLLRWTTLLDELTEILSQD